MASFAEETMEKNKKVFWRLGSLNPVYTNEDVSKECGITLDEVESLREYFLYCYVVYRANFGTDKFYKFLEEARYDEMGL